MFHPVSSDSDEDSPVSNKNTHHLSPDDERILPDCKKRRVASTGLTHVLEGMDFRQRSGSFMDSFDSHTCNLPIVTNKYSPNTGTCQDTDVESEHSGSAFSAEKSRLSMSPISCTRLPVTPGPNRCSSGYGSTSCDKENQNLFQNQMKSNRRDSFLGKENYPLNFLESERCLKDTQDVETCESVEHGSPLPMEVASIKHTPKPMEMSYNVSYQYNFLITCALLNSIVHY